MHPRYLCLNFNYLGSFQMVSAPIPNDNTCNQLTVYKHSVKSIAMTNSLHVTSYRYMISSTST